ncbi:MAG TPA: hypothetical protein VFM18_18815 [Methanosarcina sp.]|nr:hypothetical protein [Methanosarcina sp.]
MSKILRSDAGFRTKHFRNAWYVSLTAVNNHYEVCEFDDGHTLSTITLFAEFTEASLAFDAVVERYQSEGEQV